ncbi:MAG: peptidoglycan-binding protein [Nitrosomonas sp.]|nr:peptidoglycan-binding protein [Nitrosomonas sp.]
MKSLEIRILSTGVVFLFAAILLSGCGNGESTDSAENGQAGVNTKESGETVIIPEPITSLENMEEIQTLNGFDLDGDTASMDGVLDGFSEAVDEGIDAAGEAISGSADTMMSAIEDSITIAQDTAADFKEDTSAAIAEIIDDADEVVAATPNLIRQVQKALAKAGYKPGPADGVSGPRTLAALKSFQQDNNLASGELTKETLRALSVQH